MIAKMSQEIRVKVEEKITHQRNNKIKRLRRKQRIVILKRSQDNSEEELIKIQIVRLLQLIELKIKDLNQEEETRVEKETAQERKRRKLIEVTLID